MRSVDRDRLALPCEQLKRLGVRALGQGGKLQDSRPPHEHTGNEGDGENEEQEMGHSYERE